MKAIGLYFNAILCIMQYRVDLTFASLYEYLMYDNLN